MSGADLPCLRRAVDAASARRFAEVTGRRAALLGDERGVFELWIWPLRIARELELGFRIGAERVAGRAIAREVRVWPDRLELAFEHDALRATATFTAARERRALAVALALECARDVVCELRLVPDFRPMWPAGLGGRIARRDARTGALLLTEELGRFAALIGSPEADPIELDADHALPSEPLALAVPVTPARARAGPVPFLIAGAETEPPPLSDDARRGGAAASEGLARAGVVVACARDEYAALARGWRDLAGEAGAHWRDFLARTTRLETQDAHVDRAFEWAKVAIERAWVDVDGVGSGLVAGLGPAGAGERPGYGWLFDGDALVASRAMTGYGDHAGARRVLELAAGRQRADGKLMHELVLSARLCDWLGDYPYAYYKGGNTPGFIACLDHHHRGSGDDELVRDLAPHVARAFRFCESCLDQGLLSNERAGLAAVEAGALVGRMRSEVFLQSIWLSALRGVRALGPLLDADVVRDAAAREEQARAAFEGFWSEARGRYGFAQLTDGALQDDLTAYLGHPLSRGAGEPERAFASAQHLDRPDLAADWGVRFFAESSELHEPENYNTGAVFPYATNFTVLALYRHGLVTAAWRQLSALIRLTGFSGCGFVPEHLVGDRAREPERGVPHQIFSSAAVIQSLLYGMLGLEPVAAERTLVLFPALPPGQDRIELSGFRVGASVVDLELTRTRAGGRTRLGACLVRTGGPPLRVFFRPWLPPLSRDVRCALGRDEEDVACELVGGALRPAVPGTELTDALELEVSGALGPELAPLHAPFVHGAPSAELRVPAVRAEAERVTWTLWGRRGHSARIPYVSDRALQVAGADAHGPDALEVGFPGADDGSWVAREVSAAPQPVASGAP